MFAYETAGAPVYILRFIGSFDAADEAAYLAALDDLVMRPPGFVMVLVFGNSNRMSPEGYRAMALWFKRHRDDLGRLCLGLARVRPDSDPATIDDANFRKAMPFPTVVLRSEAEAMAWARLQLEAA
ncbi:MAG: hypothetical protein ACK4FJ_16360 [Ferrovibrio sp.]|uniref:hypothetical protein n=1 Tax=Ferrovibrio sp. TaxID=1917215 RepID=UPI00391D5222